MGYIFEHTMNKFKSCLSNEDLTSMVFQFGYYSDEARDSFEKCEDLRHLVNRVGFTQRSGVLISGAKDPAVNGFYSYQESLMGYRYKSEDGRRSIAFARGTWRIHGTDYWVFGDESGMPVSGWKMWAGPNNQFKEYPLSV